jgi:hypothetical protein
VTSNSVAAEYIMMWEDFDLADNQKTT